MWRCDDPTRVVLAALGGLIATAFHLPLLALLAFRASWLSFGNLLARVSMTALLIAVGVALLDGLADPASCQRHAAAG